MGKTRSAAFVIALGAQGAACSLVLGLEHGHPPAAGQDAAELEASASTDAGPRCVGDATFCDNFDESSSLDSNWTNVEVHNASPPRIDDTAARSGSRSLLYDFSAADGGDYRVSSITWPIPTSEFNRVQYSFAVKVEVSSVETILSALVLASARNVDDRHISFFITADFVLNLREQRDAPFAAAVTTPVGTLDPVRWNEITIDWNADAIRVTLNTSTVVDKALTVVRGAAGSAPTLMLGLYTDDVVQPCRVRFDDFSVWVE
jgi:hypothetical protein